MYPGRPWKDYVVIVVKHVIEPLLHYVLIAALSTEPSCPQHAFDYHHSLQAPGAQTDRHE